MKLTYIGHCVNLNIAISLTNGSVLGIFYCFLTNAFVLCIFIVLSFRFNRIGFVRERDPVAVGQEDVPVLLPHLGTGHGRQPRAHRAHAAVRLEEGRHSPPIQGRLRRSK